MIEVLLIPFLIVLVILVEYLLSRPATGIRLTLEGVKDMDIVPGNYVLTATGIPAGSVLSSIAFSTSDANVVAVIQRADDPTKADVIASNPGAATIGATALNSLGQTLSKSIDLVVAVPVPVATDIDLTLEPA